MGDLVRTVQITAIDAEGNLLGKSRNYKALIDTGATSTVIPKRVVKEVNALILQGHRTLRGKWVPAALLAVELNGKNCPIHPILAIISDALAKKAEPEAEIILGHDYLQKNRATLRYTTPHEVFCAPARRKRKRK